ncbi:hypothetical protein COD21_31450 [Bacillus cereus]|uniref:anthrax toxin lethal factor-related metalloendopeptidase n=1 Tax=Bacillus cereus TaxID=1396 RepID=UPI000BFE477A|nr:hypothetical protein [Bacillus cereus]PGT99130.1 hypothetical protein COD21_31450 [Bacillus cereus]
MSNFSDKDLDDVLAFFNLEGDYILFNVSHQMFIDRYEEITGTILHEFGHAIDKLLPDKGTDHGITKTQTFINAYNLEKDKTNFDDYFKSTPAEFFAEVFAYLYSPDPRLREKIKREAPETCKIILDAVEKGILPPDIRGLD